MRSKAAGLMACAVDLAVDARSPQSSGTTARSQAAIDWTASLEALDPQRPMEYFELAEEVADAATNDSQRELARTLFGLAGALDPDQLGRSACLALADLEADANDRRRLLALGSLLRGPGGGAGGGPAGGGGMLTPHDSGHAVAADPAAALAVSESFSHYRRGEGQNALAALKQPGAMELLTANSRILRGGIDRFIEDCNHFRGGDRSPRLDDADITRMLRFEAALLAGDQRDWSSDLVINQNQPLVEVDPDHLDRSLGVDLSRPLWRNGQWVGAEGR
jgi:hypothetical protein